MNARQRFREGGVEGTVYMDELLYLGVFLLYTIAILILGKHGFDKTDDLSEYFLAGRGLGLFSSVTSFCATWFSAASILGLPGLIYDGGVSVIWTTAVAWVLGMAGLFVISSKLYAYDVMTVPEFFRVRYDSKVLQVWIGVVLVFSYLLYVVIQIRGFGIVISQMLGVPYSVSVCLIYIFVLYTTFGGLHSVARTDAFHFFLILIGTMLGAFLIVEASGEIPLEAIQTESRSSSEGLSIWLFISAFFTLGLGVAANPQYAVRILSAKSRRTARNMMLFSLVFIVIIYVSILIIGLGSRALDGGLVFLTTDEVYPYVITYLLDTPWKGVLLISIVAACVSTANSQLLLMAGSSIYDISLPLRKTKLPNDRVVTWTRWMVFLFATSSLVIAFTPPEGIVPFSGHIWGMITVSLFFPLYGGLFTKVPKPNALRSTFGGVAAYIVAFWLIPATWQDVYHPVLPSLLIAGLLFFWTGGKRHASFH
ncbi:sodium:solute symporter family protein [Halobacillus litoralis]|uniref:sodium:solute symporter family protein n=1 Tax=Halobacillus litoralis TaxID=45668 RepID=UPI001CD3625F|nr:sodium:solute symporter family protein [Halobacillus litoralis]MCA0970482.1 sodium:solute symporter family protein [Halobacillus litoralis]